MATNELLPFANGEDANVLPTNQWEALTDILENGFQSGIARSEQVNRVLAQGAVASYVLGQLIVDQLNKDATLNKDTLYQNLVSALQENAKDACLPLAGGTMTGMVRYSTSSPVVADADDMRIHVCGGSNWDKGAHLVLTGKDEDENGAFELVCQNGDVRIQLHGKPDGSLAWDGKEVERVSSSGTNWIRYANGLQIVWSVNVGGEVATFPVAFKSRPYITATHWGSSLCFPVPKEITNTGFTMTVYATDFTLKTDSWADADWIAIGYWK